MLDYMAYQLAQRRVVEVARGALPDSPVGVPEVARDPARPSCDRAAPHRHERAPRPARRPSHRIPRARASLTADHCCGGTSRHVIRLLPSPQS